MPVRFLLGRPHRLLGPVIDAIGEQNRAGVPCILLVPEQFTLQAEMELTQRLQLPGFFQIQVFSPTRLAQRVFEYAGSPAQTRIDHRGKAMILRLLIEEALDHLVYYRGAAHTAGFVERLATLIADLKASHITPEELQHSAEQLPQGRLRMKLADTALLYERYEQRLAGRFVDGEDVENALDERMSDSGLFSGHSVYVYGFDMITQIFARHLKTIAGLVPELTVALVADDRSSDTLIFEPVLESLARFEMLLDAEGIAHHRTAILDPLDASSSIRHLETHLFSDDTTPYTKEVQSIRLHTAASSDAQMHHVAAQVLMLLQDRGHQLSDLSIQYPPGSACGQSLRRILHQYNIAAHVQEQRVALHHPMIQMLLCALRCLTQSFRLEDVCGFLKSSFSPLSDLEACELENYALAHGLKGIAWLSPLKRGTDEEKERLEPLRAALMAPLLTLRAALRASRRTEDSLKAFYDFLLLLEVPAKLSQEQQVLGELRLLPEISYSTQVWNALMEVLSQLQALLPPRAPRLALLVEMLFAGLSATELRALPAEADMLVCGEIGNVRTGRVRTLFLIDMVDAGGSSGASSLLDDLERRQVQAELGANVGIQDTHRQMLKRVDLLSAIASAGERLLVAYPQSDSSGRAQRPDMLVGVLETLFPALHVTGGVLDEGLGDRLCAPVPALSALALVLRDVRASESLPEDFQAALGYLSTLPEARDALRQMQEALHARFETTPLSAETARRALGDAPLSVSRLETYAACPFQHYVDYWLRPQPRQIYGVYKQDLGLFYHDVLVDYAEQVQLSAQWPHLSREETDALLLRTAEPFLAAWQEGPLGEDARTLAQGRQVVRIAQSAAWALVRQAQKTAFRPTLLEIPFGMEPDGPPPLILPLEDGGQALLRGRIDRIDIWRDPSGIPYVTVVDYKSTTAPPRLSGGKLYGGLQLQLPLYLLAALSIVPGAKPAGAYYVQLHDPLVESLSEASEEIEKDLDKEMAPRGITVSDPALSGVTPSFRSGNVSPENLSSLIHRSERQAASLIHSMKKGEITALPTGEENRLPCSYCRFRAICGLDPMLPGAKARILPKQRLDTVLKEGFDGLSFQEGPIQL